jgi:hypothetical protein
MNTKPLTQPDNLQPKSKFSMNDKKAGCLVLSLLFIVLIIFTIGIYLGWKYFKKESATEQKTETTSTDTPDRVTSPDKKNSRDSVKSSKFIEGKILASASSLNEKNKIILWILSEGAVSGKSIDKSMNTITMYNPVEKSIIRKITGKFVVQGSNYRFNSYKDKVWFISEMSSGKAGTDDLIYAYDSQTGEEILNTKSFAEKYDELSPGINSFSLDVQFAAVKITAKDGNKFVYKIKDEKLITEKDWAKEKYYPGKETKVPYFALKPEPYTEGRYQLVRLLVPKSKVPDMDFKSPYITDVFVLNFYREGEKEIVPGKVFFRGQLCYFDDEIITIMSNKDVDQKSEVKMSCLNTDGKELWTKPASAFFNASINYFNTVKRLDNSLLVTIKDKGIKAFDYKTGEEFWSLDF